MRTVRPIKNDEVVKDILETLGRSENWHDRRMYLLFATGVYTGLRISDIVNLRVENVQGEYLRVIEKKTGKEQAILINRSYRQILNACLEGKADNDYLFPSRKRRPDGTERPITTRSAQYDMHIIKGRFGIKDAFCCHSLRKTYGYFMYKRNAPLDTLRKQFNHSTENVTRRYIGVDEEERNKYLSGLSYGYKPPKKGKAGRRPEGVPLETHYHDRTENGRKYGEKMRMAAENAKKKKGR